MCDDGPGAPMAVSGGWADDDTFRADVIFLETPHRLRLTARITLGTYEAAWSSPRLHRGRLSDQQMLR